MMNAVPERLLNLPPSCPSEPLQDDDALNCGARRELGRPLNIHLFNALSTHALIYDSPLTKSPRSSIFYVTSLQLVANRGMLPSTTLDSTTAVRLSMSQSCSSETKPLNPFKLLGRAEPKQVRQDGGKRKSATGATEALLLDHSPCPQNLRRIESLTN